jgi:hypothetical protein
MTVVSLPRIRQKGRPKSYTVAQKVRNRTDMPFSAARLRLASSPWVSGKQIIINEYKGVR